MTHFKSASLGLVLLISAGGMAFAQISGSMGTGGGMSNSNTMGGATGDQPMAVSKSDMKKIDHCKAMSSDMMMKNATCMKMMKMHPDMMQGDAMAPK